MQLRSYYTRDVDRKHILLLPREERRHEYCLLYAQPWLRRVTRVVKEQDQRRTGVVHYSAWLRHP
jgi:hypothetical protein